MFAAAVAAAGSAASAQPEAVEQSRIEIMKDSPALRLVIENGAVTEATLDGKDIPHDRIVRQGQRLRIVDEQGRTVVETSVLETPPAPPTPATPRPDGPSSKGGDAPRDRVYRYTYSTDPDGKSTLRQTENPKVMVGISMAAPDRLLLGHFGLKDGTAAMIASVYRGLGASRAGLKPYDLIVDVEGRGKADDATVREVLRGKEPGQSVRLTIVQGGVRRDVSIELEKFDEERLSKAEVDSIDAGEGVFAFPNNIQIKGLEGLNNLEMDQKSLAEALRMAERYRAKAGEPNVRFFTRSGTGDVRGFMNDERRNAAELAQQAEQMAKLAEEKTRAVAERDRLEEKLARMEELLRRLSEKLDKLEPGRSGGR